MPRVVVIFNRKSGRNRRAPDARAAQIRNRLSSADRFIDARSLSDLAAAAEDIAADPPRVVAISGGDGTLGVTLTALTRAHEGRELPEIALLRSGTMNTVANAVGARRASAPQTLGRVLRVLATHSHLPTVTRRLLRVNDDYGFLFGTGVVHGFLEAYYAGGTPSPRVAASTLVRGMASALVGGEMVRKMAEPFRGRVTIGTAAPLERDTFFAVAAGTVDQIGLGFRPFYRTSHSPDGFQILAIHTSPLGFVSQLPRIRLARPMGSRHVTESLTQSASLEAQSGTVEYMLDGDLRSHRGTVRLSVGPAVRFLLA